LELIEEVAVPGTGEASAFSLPLAVSPDRRFLYAALRAAPFPVSAFKIAPEDGRLVHLATAPLPYSAPFLTTDRTGRYLLTASYHDGAIAVNPINAEGAVSAPAKQIIAAGPKMHCVAMDASNQHLYAACLGSDAIFHYRFDARTGALSGEPASTTTTPSNTGPRHLAFHPGGRFLYAIGELDGTIAAYAVDEGTGTLREFQRISLLPSDFRGTPSAADLHVTPDGRFLYGSERASSIIAGFSIDALTGMLAALGSVPVERVPRAIAIDPHGHLLLVAGLECNRLGVYAISDGGALVKLADHEAGLAPSWIEIVGL
jgi:6-phosphogluconolactonase